MKWRWCRGKGFITARGIRVEWGPSWTMTIERRKRDGGLEMSLRENNSHSNVIERPKRMFDSYVSGPFVFRAVR
jgi:hypothetical protein